MRVLHVFEQYLNQTMNWAYRLISHTPDMEVFSTAPIVLGNRFRDPNIYTITPSWQHHLPKDEWQVPLALTLFSRWQTEISGGFSRHLVRAIKRHDIELLHAHFAQVGCWTMEAARKTKIPLVVSFYGYDYEYLPLTKPRYVKLYKQMFEQASAFICEGSFGAQILEKMGCPKHKIHIVHLGIEPGKVPFFERKKIPGQLRLVQAATWTEKKGQLIALKAFHRALPYCPNMQLTFVGEPVDKKIVAQAKHYITQNKLEDHVTLLDFVDSSKFMIFLKGFEVFIHPSQFALNRDCEGGAPVVLLDAQATGMPIIASTHCDIPEEVVHEKTGLLSPEKDIETLAASIRRFYQMEEKEYLLFAHAARLHVSSHYDVVMSGQQLSEIYLSLI